MTTPHRYRISGDIYYITSVTQDRLRIFTSPTYIIALLDSLNFYRYQYQMKLVGFVVMPDHMHLLIWPQGAPEVSGFMRDYKRYTSGRIARQAQVEGRADWIAAFEAAGQTTNRAERKVWQDSFWEQVVFEDRVVRQKLNYLHRNPVRQGLVTDPAAYPYSSYRNYTHGDQSLIEIDTDWV